MKPDKFHWGLLVALQLLLIGCGAEPPQVPSEAKENVDPMPQSICGENDTRELSAYAAAGRIMPNEGDVPCTGFILSNGKLATAGHCVDDGGLNFVGFNVPASQANGTMTPVANTDRYAVIQESIRYENDKGDHDGPADWAIFEVHANAETELMPLAAQGASFQITQDLPAVDDAVIVIGYGRDAPRPVRNHVQQEARGPVTEIDNEDAADVNIDYRADTMSGCSGGPVVRQDAPGTAIAIHMAGTCHVAGIEANMGQSFATAQLWAAANN